MRKDFGQKTTDGYDWFWGLTFKTSKTGRVMVLFPMSSMKLGALRALPNRSIAYHKIGDVTEKATTRILSTLIDGVKAAMPQEART